MSVQITPEPNEVEREAILSALADEQVEPRTVSEWAGALLPMREETEQEP